MQSDDCQTDHHHHFYSAQNPSVYCKTQAINEPLSWLLAGVHVPATVGKPFLLKWGKQKSSSDGKTSLIILCV